MATTMITSEKSPATWSSSMTISKSLNIHRTSVPRNRIRSRRTVDRIRAPSPMGNRRKPFRRLLFRPVRWNQCICSTIHHQHLDTSGGACRCTSDESQPNVWTGESSYKEKDRCELSQWYSQSYRVFHRSDGYASSAVGETFCWKAEQRWFIVPKFQYGGTERHS